MPTPVASPPTEAVFTSTPERSHQVQQSPSFSPVREALAFMTEGPEEAAPKKKKKKMPISTRTISLTAAERADLINGEWLDDNIIHSAQLLLVRQADGKFTGFNNPLLLKNLPPPDLPFIQIFNASGCHWVVASNIRCDAGTVKLYDSSCKSKMDSARDSATNQILANLCKTEEALMSVEMVNVQQQQGGSDCGVFAIAFATALVFGQCPSMRNYTQKKMRQHLLDCIEKKELTPFPSRKVNTRYYSPLYHFYTVMVICKCRGVEAGIQIMCDHCGMWYHIACIGMAKDSPLLNDSNAWLCSSCK